MAAAAEAAERGGVQKLGVPGNSELSHLGGDRCLGLGVNSAGSSKFPADEHGEVNKLRELLNFLAQVLANQGIGGIGILQAKPFQRHVGFLGSL